MSFFKRFVKKNKNSSSSTPPTHRRFRFTLTIHSITSIDAKEHSEFSVVAQRGRKQAQTALRAPPNLESESVSFQDEVLSFETSIRMLNEAQLKPKSVRLTVVEKSAGAKQKQVVKVKQNLAQFVAINGQESFKKAISFPLKKWKGQAQAKLNLTIESVSVAPSATDMTESEMSTAGGVDSYQDFDSVDRQDVDEANKDPAVAEMVDGTTTGAKAPTPRRGAQLAEPQIDNSAQSSARTQGANSERSAHSARGENVPYEELTLLFTTDDRVVKALYSSIDAENAGSLAQVLTDLARGMGTTQRFSESLLRAEFKHCTETQDQILRLNSFATTCIDRILRFSANAYLKQVVAPLIEDLLNDQDVDFEVDPSKFPDKSSTEIDELVQFHSMQLQEWSRKVADVLFSKSNALELPPIVRQMAHIVQEQCEMTSLPTERLLGHLIILRMLNPAISLPFTKGIIDYEPNEKQKRNLIWLSKVLQHVSNRTHFQESQPAAEELNEVVEEYFDVCDEFLLEACAPRKEYEAGLAKADKKMSTALHKRAVSQSVELKLNVNLILETIQKVKPTFIEQYQCTEVQLNEMLRTGLPVHSDPLQSIKMDVQSIRRLFLKKKWTTAKTQLQQLDTKYANASDEVRFELSVLWSTLFNNRCLHYVRQKNAKKAFTYSEDALRYLLRHKREQYVQQDRSYVYNLIYFNSQSTLASYYLFVGNTDKAVESMAQALSTLRDETFVQQLSADVLHLWVLEAIKIFTHTYSQSEGAASQMQQGGVQEKSLAELRDVVIPQMSEKPSENVVRLLDSFVGAN